MQIAHTLPTNNITVAAVVGTLQRRVTLAANGIRGGSKVAAGGNKGLHRREVTVVSRGQQGRPADGGARLQRGAARCNVWLHVHICERERTRYEVKRKSEQLKNKTLSSSTLITSVEQKSEKKRHKPYQVAH